MPFGFSARPVQIATCNFPPRSCDLFTLPPHAPCRLQQMLPILYAKHPKLCLHTPRADCNGIPVSSGGNYTDLCLHTPRADCNSAEKKRKERKRPLPPHAPCRLQRGRMLDNQIARTFLCLHTPRADCNLTGAFADAASQALPPHAPCRLQQGLCQPRQPIRHFASTRPVQIAT